MFEQKHNQKSINADVYQCDIVLSGTCLYFNLFLPWSEIMINDAK